MLFGGGLESPLKETWVSWIDPANANSNFARLRPVFFLLILGILLFFFRMPLFEAPFERDQGTYATIARGWMQGTLPYHDLWDNKGPLLFLWYILSFAWLGENVVAPRVMAALASAFTLPFVWAASRSLFGRRVAALTAILFTLSFMNVYLQVTANAEIFMLLPMAAGFWAFAAGIRKNSLLWILAAGVLTSLAVFTKQSAIFTFIGYSVWAGAICLQHPKEWKRQARIIGALAIGGVLGALPFVAYFARHGALYDLWYAMFGFNLSWANEQSFWLKLVPPLFIEPGPLFGGLIFWIATVVGFWMLWKRRERNAGLVVCFLAFSEAAAMAMGKGSAHYSIQLLPGAAMCAAFGSPYLLQRWRHGGRGFKAMLLTTTTITVATILFAYLKPTAEDRFKVQYTFRDYADDAIGARSIASAVSALSDPGECIYEWGRSSQIYFLADRRPCSRWLYNRPYEVDRSMLTEVMTDLKKREPAVILLTEESPPPLELQSFIGERYCYAGQTKYAKLYTLIGKRNKKAQTARI
jgi:4-amino-4-deoxy-L-arabinose transferase-like glycosyltransferase